MMKIFCYSVFQFRLDSNELAESPEFSGKVIVQLMQGISPT